MSAIFVQQLSLGGDGPTVAVKDSIDIAGIPTRSGSRVLTDAPPAERHADVVVALLAAGCRIVGKTNLHEFAYGVTGINDWFGTPINPHFPDRIPGGSSSGSAAAVAAGLVDFSLGTDTGGSIRVPAACCGVVGLKPSFGRLSRAGVSPVMSSLDCVGPLARCVTDIERAMTILDRDFAVAPEPTSPLLGVVDVTAEPEVVDAMEHALSAWGARCISITLSGLQRAFEAGLAVIGAETWAAVGVHAVSPDIGPDVRARLLSAQHISPEELERAEVVRAAFTAEVDAALDRVDVLVLPTMSAPPLTLRAARDARAALGVTALTRPFNLSGHPAISLPLPPTADFSVGLQLVGRRGADAALCAIAREFERALGHSRPLPAHQPLPAQEYSS